MRKFSSDRQPCRFRHVHIPWGVFGIIAICIIAISIVCFWLDRRGISINGVKVTLRGIGGYEDVLRDGMKFTVFPDGDGTLEQAFYPVLDEDLHLTFNDIVNGSVQLDWHYDYDRNEFIRLAGIVNAKAVRSEDAYIDTVNETIVHEVYGNELDVEGIIAALDGKDKVLLSDHYVQPGRKEVDLLPSLDALSEARDWHVSYAGSDLRFDMPHDAVSIDRDGNIIYGDPGFIDGFVDDVCATYDTLGKPVLFNSHSGDVVEVPGGTFGNKVDAEAECNALRQLFRDGVSVDGRVPVYSVSMGSISGDYVEVSRDEQHVWLWKDGEVISESDCVTGCVAKDRETPTGVYYIDMRQPGKMLHPAGESSGSWVNRWMRFTPDGCGLHDASWRGRFGGSIYKTSGSHGCVNLPSSYAYDLYEDVYVGLPVIVY